MAQQIMPNAKAYSPRTTLSDSTDVRFHISGVGDLEDPSV